MYENHLILSLTHPITHKQEVCRRIKVINRIGCDLIKYIILEIIDKININLISKLNLTKILTLGVKNELIFQF